MNLVRRVDRLEAHLRGQREDDFYCCRQLIYDPRQWEIGEEEAIAQMQAKELDHLVASGEIREQDRERVLFIVNTIVYPPEYPDDPRTDAA